MKHIVLLPLFVAFVTPKVLEIPIKRVESFREKLVRQGLWDKYTAAKMLLSNERLSNQANDLPDQTAYDFEDVRYLAYISVGTPKRGTRPQTFKVMFDTGSFNFFVLDKTAPDLPPYNSKLACPTACGNLTADICSYVCHQSCCESTFAQPLSAICEKKQCFDSSLSRTYRRTRKTFHSGYGSGERYFEGPVGIDSVFLGDDRSVEVKHMRFGQTTHYPNTYPSKPFDGIMGFAPAVRTPSKFTASKTVIQTAFDEGLLEENMFSIYVKKEGKGSFNVTAGKFTLGGPNYDDCLKANFYPLEPRNATMWKFRIDGVKWGRARDNRRGLSAYTDSGDATVGANYETMSPLIKAAGGWQIPGTRNFASKCNGPLKPLIITIGGHKYPIPAKQLIGDEVPSQPGNCFLSVATGKPAYGVDWVLGLPFIREYCQVMDVAAKEIGFARHKY